MHKESLQLKSFCLRSQSGQAMIEYILVVTVSVIIMLSLGTKMYKPFNDFINTMMGSYIQCLMETGELPKFAAPDEQGNSVCNPFNFAQNQNALDEKKEEEKKDNEDKIDPPKNRQPPTSSYAGSSRRAFNIGPNIVGTSGTDGAVRLQGGSDGGSSSQSGGRFFDAGTNITYKRERSVAFTGGIGTETSEKKDKKKEKKTSTPVAEGEAGIGGGKKGKLQLKQPEKRAVSSDDNLGEGFSISQIIKIIFIAGIIILIVILLGGQILQVSKNWEK